MKTKDKKQLHTKTKEELAVQLKESKNELFTLQMDQARHQLKNTRSLHMKRKDIARILTSLKQKEEQHAKNA